MESEYVKSNALCRSVTKRQPTGQGLNIADNCPYKVSQAKLIRVVQRAATLNGGQQIPQAIKTFREDAMVEVGGTRYGDDTIYVGGAPGQGFGMNAGFINGEVTIFNDFQGTHTEPKLISKKYTGDYGDWTAANAAADRRNVNSDGVTSADPFDLFTERAPCSSPGHNCRGHLLHRRYKTNDVVNSHFVSGVGVETVASAYIPQAEHKFPAYAFIVRPDVPYHLQGTKKVGSEVSSSSARTPSSVKKDPKQPTLFDYLARKGTV
ncbi:hypothetical protein [Culturomica massiliensis]|uniref:hypothetical protein n=1 Tax=Culturomica massiliensis TaxID=1841857 RepID=UPI0026702519|nr:hypothetical protein [Culturomica massiliensis]